MAGAAATLPCVADAVEETATPIVEPGTPGAVQCRAFGCHNWFVKQSGRHIYCKGPGCTFKRGAPPAFELEPPEGAAQELLRRLQEMEEPESGPSMYVARNRAIQEALRAADPQAVWGALIDSAAVLVVWADRVANGELEATMPKQPPRVPGPQQGQQRPIGLVHAVLSSHKRTYALGERRVELVYELAGAREHLRSAQLAVEQTQGSPAEEDARVACVEVQTKVDAVERALQSVEAAWQERGASMEQLESAAEATGALS
jgi:hypothetical protein